MAIAAEGEAAGPYRGMSDTNVRRMSGWT